MQYISSQFCTNHCGPTDFIVWIFDLVFPKVLFRFEEFSASAVPIWELFPGTIDCKASFQTDELALLATWARHGNFSFNDLVAHPAWPNGQCSGCEQGPKDERKAACNHFNAGKLSFGGSECVEKSGDPLMADMAPELFNAIHYSYIPFLNTIFTPKSIRLGKDSCHLAPNVQPCGSVTLTYLEIQHNSVVLSFCSQQKST